MTVYVPLIAGVAVFVGGHFLLSAPGIRPALVARLGEKGFLAGYSLVILAGLVAMILGYRWAPVELLWQPPSWGRHLAMALMPLALILIVLGVSSPNPTAAGGEDLLKDTVAPQGVTTVTRHPFLWGCGLWAGAHLLVNGDVAGMIVFSGVGVLSFGGMFAIDSKRARQLGDAWATYARNTSLVPFAGPGRIDWQGMGWARPALGLVLYGGIVALHGWAFNRPLF